MTTRIHVKRVTGEDYVAKRVCENTSTPLFEYIYIWTANVWRILYISKIDPRDVHISHCLSISVVLLATQVVRGLCHVIAFTKSISHCTTDVSEVIKVSRAFSGVESILKSPLSYQSIPWCCLKPRLLVFHFSKNLLYVYIWFLLAMRQILLFINKKRDSTNQDSRVRRLDQVWTVLFPHLLV